MQHDGDLGIVRGCIYPRRNHRHTELPGVRTDAQVVRGHGMGVVPAGAGWALA